MIDPPRFRSFQAAKLFAGEPSLDLRTGDFDMEYQGGTWDFDQLEGVEVLFGSKLPDRVGILSLIVSPGANVTPAATPFVRPDWAARANHAAEAIGLPPLLARPLAEFLAVFPTLTTGGKWADGVRRFVSGDVGEFYVEGIVHDTEGLLRLELRHLPTVAANRLGV